MRKKFIVLYVARKYNMENKIERNQIVANTMQFLHGRFVQFGA